MLVVVSDCEEASMLCWESLNIIIVNVPGFGMYLLFFTRAFNVYILLEAMKTRKILSYSANWPAIKMHHGKLEGFPDCRAPLPQ